MLASPDALSPQVRPFHSFWTMAKLLSPACAGASLQASGGCPHSSAHKSWEEVPEGCSAGLPPNHCWGMQLHTCAGGCGGLACADTPPGLQRPQRGYRELHAHPELRTGATRTHKAQHSHPLLSWLSWPGPHPVLLSLSLSLGWLVPRLLP